MRRAVATPEVTKPAKDTGGGFAGRRGVKSGLRARRRGRACVRAREVSSWVGWELHKVGCAVSRPSEGPFTHLLARLLAVAPVAALQVDQPVELGVWSAGLCQKQARQRAVVTHRLRVNNHVHERQLRRATAQLLGRRGRGAACSPRGRHCQQHGEHTTAQHAPCS
jgi:hypothetical protein